jgi:hypothetical protein
MRPIALLLALALGAACAPVTDAPGAAVPDAERWRLGAGAHPAAIVGLPAGIVFDREGVPVPNAPPRTVRIKARCLNCPSGIGLEFDARTPEPPWELDPGIAEAIRSFVVFPHTGTWIFEPVGVQLLVRSPTSTDPPVVAVRPWSGPMPPGCEVDRIADVLVRLAQAYQAGGELAKVLDPLVSFSMSGPPQPTFRTRSRDAVVKYVHRRSSVGERVYPYVVYAADTGANAVELAVYFVRAAPDLPNARDGFRQAVAGARMHCADGLLLRFNADLLGD